MSCCLAIAGHAQYYPVQNTDLSIGGAEQFTTPITTQVSQLYQATTRSTAILASVKEHPSAFAGFEVNYQYDALSDAHETANSSSTPAPTSMQECSGGYLIHARLGSLQPFLAVGGGELYFENPNGAKGDFRTTGLLDFGVDIPFPNQHLGVTLQGHTLYYHALAPVSEMQSTNWVATTEPSMAFYLRF